jgi:hypothetical protein
VEKGEDSIGVLQRGQGGQAGWPHFSQFGWLDQTFLALAQPLGQRRAGRGWAHGVGTRPGLRDSGRARYSSRSVWESRR